MNSRSLSVRLVAWYAGVLTLVFVLLGLLTILLLRHALEANVLDNQARRARQIAETLVAHTRASTEAQLGAEVENLYSPEANDRFIRISRADGTPVYVSGAPKDVPFDPAQVPPASGRCAPAQGRPAGRDAADRHARERRGGRHALSRGGRHLGGGE